MTEVTGVQLEQKRFVVNPESMEGMRDIRGAFEDLQNKYPWLSGLGFFGSRTKGKEHKKSDYDFVIFYQGDKIHNPFTEHENDWRDIYNTLRTKQNFVLDDHHLSLWEGGLVIDISQESTDQRIKEFMNISKPLTDPKFNKTTPNRGVPTRRLSFRFLLSIGDEVYENRRYILERLKSDKLGDKYFRIIMEDLALLERGNKDDPKGSPPYKRYPKTIEEAERYFLTKK